MAMTQKQHKQMLERSTVLGIVNNKQELVAMRALVKHRKFSIPQDLPNQDRQEQNLAAYQNHTVIRRDYRGSSLSHRIAEHTIRWVKEQGFSGIRTSVAPENGVNIRYLTKNGYRIVDFVQDLYGPGEDRFHAYYEIAHPNNMYREKLDLAGRIANDQIPKATKCGETLSSKFVLVNLSRREGLFTRSLFDWVLNKQKYKGVLLLREEEMWKEASNHHNYLLCQMA